MNKVWCLKAAAGSRRIREPSQRFLLAGDAFQYFGGWPWNTQLVSKADEPKSFEEFAEPKWKGKLLARAADAEVLIAIAEQKYKSSR